MRPRVLRQVPEVGADEIADGDQVTIGAVAAHALAARMRPLMSSSRGLPSRPATNARHVDLDDRLVLKEIQMLPTARDTIQPSPITLCLELVRPGAVRATLAGQSGQAGQLMASVMGHGT